MVNNNTLRAHSAVTPTLIKIDRFSSTKRPTNKGFLFGFFIIFIVNRQCSDEAKLFHLIKKPSKIKMKECK